MKLLTTWLAVVAATSTIALTSASAKPPMSAGSGADMSMGKDPGGHGRRVRITYQNLTAGQVFSPSAFIAHGEGAEPLFTQGRPASFGLMRLAEEGASGGLLEGAAKMGKVVGAMAVAVPTMPGQSRTVDIEVTRDHPMISGVWMLAMTNDGFTGISGVNAFDLKQPVSMEIIAWDAGTEKNNERKGDLIAMMGAGRDPEGGVVQRHKGIRGDADAPAAWRFDPSRPVARVTITPLTNAPDMSRR